MDVDLPAVCVAAILRAAAPQTVTVHDVTPLTIAAHYASDFAPPTGDIAISVLADDPGIATVSTSETP